MKIPVLDKVLVAERHRRRMGASGQFIAPVARTYQAIPEDAPWLTSLTSGRFTLTKPNKHGEIGQGFHERQPDEEDSWLAELYRTVWALSEKHNWDNRCSSIDEAVKRMSSSGLVPKALVVPFSTLSSVVEQDLTEDEADRITMGNGYVTEVDGVRVFSARNAIPANAALLFTDASLAGFYTRVHDHVGVTLLRANRSVVLVGGDAVG